MPVDQVDVLLDIVHDGNSTRRDVARAIIQITDDTPGLDLEEVFAAITRRWSPTGARYIRSYIVQLKRERAEQAQRKMY